MMFWKKNNRLLFEHVPKCGGVSVSGYLRQNYRSDEIFELNGGKPHQSLDEFRALSSDEQSRFRLVLGHGAHQLVGLCPEHTVCATILRNPIDRIVSHYYFVLASPDHYLYEQVTSEDMSLTDYVTSGISGELRNNYVCRFLQISADEAEAEPDHHIQEAYELLAARYTVGVLEHLDDAMNSIRRAANLKRRWKNQRLNTTKKRRSIQEISDTERRAIAKVNSMDVELYERVVKSLV